MMKKYWMVLIPILMTLGFARCSKEPEANEPYKPTKFCLYLGVAKICCKEVWPAGHGTSMLMNCDNGIKKIWNATNFWEEPCD
jgi:hypothetical protein